MGANETTTIDDLATSAAAVGTGKLLSESSYKEMTDSKLIGFGTKQPDCVPSCFTQVDAYNYGLGVVRSGAWIIQNPLTQPDDLAAQSRQVRLKRDTVPASAAPNTIAIGRPLSNHGLIRNSQSRQLQRVVRAPPSTRFLS